MAEHNVVIFSLIFSYAIIYLFYRYIKTKKVGKGKDLEVKNEA